MPASVHFRCEADGDLHWPDFLNALAGLAACHCCGAGLGGASAARPSPPARLRDPRRWRDHPARKTGALATLDAFTLPNVTLRAQDAPPLSPVDVRIENGRIAKIAPANSLSRDVVEACRGAAVSPALLDLHVHMPPWNALRLTRLFLLLTLRHGVTIVRDAGDADGTATPAALALVRGGALPGPEILYAYAFVGQGAKRWANTLTFENPAEADAIVEALAELGASWVKSYENLTPAHIAALTKAARARGLGVMGHTPTGSRIEDAALPDAQHYFGVPEPAELARDHVFERHVAWDSVDARRMDVVVAASVAQRMAHTPTLSMLRALLGMDGRAPESARRAGAFLPRFYSEIVWSPVHGLPAYRGLGAADFDRAARAVDKKLALTRRLYEAGATLRLGTDTQQPFVVPGHALHAEMAAFQDAGIPSAAVWRMATRDAAGALGIDDHGFLREGDRADLIVSNSAETPPPPERFIAVVAGGRLAFTADLDREIEEERARFDGQLAHHVTRWLSRMSLRRAARRFTS